MSSLELDEILSLKWSLDEDGGGEAVLFVKHTADVPGGRYEFDDLSELPDIVEAIIADEGGQSGEWSGN